MHEVILHATINSCLNHFTWLTKNIGLEAMSAAKLSEKYPWAFVDKGRITNAAGELVVWRVAFVFKNKEDAFRFKLMV